MNILYFHQHFSTPKGATAIRSYQMAQHLIARGHQVTMVCGSYGGANTGLSEPFIKGRRQGYIDGIKIIEFDLSCDNQDGLLKRARIFLNFAFKSTFLVFQETYDLLFATSTPLTVAIPGIIARWFARKPFVFEVRDLWPELPKAMQVVRSRLVLGMLSILEWSAYHSANRLIGLSPGIVEGIVRCNIPPAKVTLIPNGCDLNIFAKEATLWRPKEVATNDFMAVFTGAHGIANGLDALLDAAIILKKKSCTTIKLVLIGQGKLKLALQARARAAGLDNVIFHDSVDKLRLVGLMQSANLGLQLLANVPAFYYGTSPNKFFDYIAVGLPVLTNYPGWLADLIEQHDCGVVVAPDNAAALANALQHAASNPTLLREQGLRARRLAVTAFDRRLLANNFVNWLEGT